MRAGIHPEYLETQVVCSCGNSFVTRSTVASLHVELCNDCHPFYTGKQKLVDTGGRVERFRRRVQKAADKQATAKPKPPRVRAKATATAVKQKVAANPPVVEDTSTVEAGVAPDDVSVKGAAAAGAAPEVAAVE